MSVPGSAREALVLGAGVVGLAAAHRLLERGWRVTVWTADALADTTSAVAAALWFPFRAAPADRVARWGAATFRVLARQAAESPECGVRLREGIALSRVPVPDPEWAAALPSLRRARADELPAGYVDGHAFTAPVADMSVYLPWLAGRVVALGGDVVRRRAASLDEALAECPTVVNCTGLGAGALVGDARVYPIRGQVVRVANPGLTRVLLDDEHPEGVTYVIPRGDDCVLGGTAEDGRWSREPDPATADAIRRRCIALEPRLAGAAVLEHRVGLRPGRDAVRLEREARAGGTCVHDYGHGGSGVTLAWGCADDVAALLEA